MYLRVERETYFAGLLERWLDAYNRRTDVMEASSDVVVQRKLDELAASLQGSTDALQQSINEDKGE